MLYSCIHIYIYIYAVYIVVTCCIHVSIPLISLENTLIENISFINNPLPTKLYVQVLI